MRKQSVGGVVTLGGLPPRMRAEIHRLEGEWERLTRERMALGLSGDMAKSQAAEELQLLPRLLALGVGWMQGLDVQVEQAGAEMDERGR